ncbi:MAG: hypothetical protein H6839_14645 [Planctomycetes bacterium]|nr:hypothetical protein [Planctomycetota bacterium]
MSLEDLDAAKNSALMETNAQGVLAYLDKMENAGDRFKRRWVWELMQNARDAAGDEGVNASITLNKQEVVFQHSGRPFGADEIAHLIFHGSSKHGDENAVGRYGSGFITTHLLSSIVFVRGQLASGESFEVKLDRSGRDQTTLAEAMNATWDAFKDFCRQRHKNGGPTSFEYPLDEFSLPTARAGIADLLSTAPLVVALNRRIRSIVCVNDVGQRSDYSCIERSPFEGSELLHHVRVQERQDNQQGVVHHYATLDAESFSLLVPLIVEEDHVRVAMTSDCPKLFVAFPLLDSEQFPIPMVVSSEEFHPLEDRDGIYLAKDGPSTGKNKEILAAALSGMVEFCREAVRLGWEGRLSLLLFPRTPEKEWLDQSWLKEALVEVLSDVLELPMLLTQGDTHVIPRNACILAGRGEEHRALYRLVNHWKPLSSKLPVDHESNEWAEALALWSELGVANDVTGVHFTLTDICESVSNARDLDSLAGSIGEGQSPFDWLDSLYRLILSRDEDKLFDTYSVLPSRGGSLRKRSELSLGTEIDADLCAIADELGCEVSSQLLASEVTAPGVGKLLKEMTSADVISKAVRATQKTVNEDELPDAVKRLYVRLFSWLAMNGYQSECLGVPTIMDTGSLPDALVVRSAPSTPIPLVPVSQWPPELRALGEFIPPQFILHEAYCETINEVGWRALAEEGCVLATPVQSIQEQVDVFLPDEPLPEGKDGKTLSHSSRDPVRLIDILHFHGGTSNVIRSVRQSPARAVQLIRTLVQNVLPIQPEALEPMEADCEACGSKHTYYPAKWLNTLSRVSWVPVGDKRSDRPSADSLSRLLQLAGNTGKDVLDGSLAMKLCRALKIDLSNMVLRSIAPDEDQRDRAVNALAKFLLNSNVEDLEWIAEDIQTSPEVLELLRDRRTKKRAAVVNNQVGGLVEQLLMEVLADQGLRVERTGRGSDCMVEYDLIDRGQEVYLKIAAPEVATLIEIKSARSTAVRMTETQARTAISDVDRFVLCVVPISSTSPTKEEVAASARFVFDMAPRLAESVRKLDDINELVTTRPATSTGVELQYEDESPRFSVNNEVWQEYGVPIDQFVRKLREAQS